MHTHTKNESQLWTKLRQGDIQALNELYTIYADSLYDYGTKLTRDPEYVMDSIHDLFLGPPTYSKPRILRSFCVQLALLGALCSPLSASGSVADSLRACSPSGRICLKVWMDDTLKYGITYDGKTILEPSAIDFLLENNLSLSQNNRIRTSSITNVKSQIVSPVPEKRKIVPDVYTEMSIKFKQPYSVAFRIYDDGVAYRISTHFKQAITVLNEVAEFNFPDMPSAYFPQVQKKEDADIFHTSFEEEYPLRKLDSISDGTMGYSPVLVVPLSGPKIGITESDLYDYPGMFLGGTGSSTFKGVFAGYPKEEIETNELYSQIKVISRQ